jgi:membrane-bound lytic murein transglycosylase A
MSLCNASWVRADKFPEKLSIDDGGRFFFQRVDYSRLLGWGLDDYREGVRVLLESCTVLTKARRNKPVFPQLSNKVFGRDFYSVCRLADIIKNYGSDLLQAFFEKYFVPYEVVDIQSKRSLFTGYYIPTILASRTKNSVFKYPIYKKPKDIISYHCNYTREQIHQGALEGKDLEILYTNDPVDLYFLHIQGSGKARLVDEDKFVYLGFDGKNNCNYSSPVSFRDTGSRDQLQQRRRMDSQALKRELKRMDDNIMHSILNLNDSYVFFKFLKNERFSGAFGTSVVPFRTMAVDDNFIPLGFPMWVSTTHTLEHSHNSFNRLVIANDTGAIIKGVNRGDIFFGFDREGEKNSSFQFAEGKYYLLIPKKILTRLAN